MTSLAEPPPGECRAHALVVGISDYLHVQPLPPAVAAGARELAALLADPLLGGYPPDQVRCLLDQAATGEAIREELRSLAALARPQDVVVLYFAGHASPGAAGDGGVYLQPVEVDPMGPGGVAASALPGAEVLSAVGALAARRVLVILDCCHAGGVGPSPDLPNAAGALPPNGDPPREGGLPESFVAGLEGARGRVILAASRAGERSWLPGDGGPSVFTRHLLAGLRGAAPGRGGWIGVWELFAHVQDRVTAERPDQHPLLRGALEENFPVALHLGGRGAAEPAAGDAAGWPYDAYLSFADCEADVRYARQVLVPALRAAGLRLAVCRDCEEPGAPEVVAVEHAVLRSRRTVVLLSDAYLADRMNELIDVMAQTLGLEEGTRRLVPVRFAGFDPSRLPLRLRMLVGLDLGRERDFHRLVEVLHAPLPRAVPAARAVSGIVPRAGSGRS
ncbi:MAG TPA: caspase family protein [Thermoanaerobaculia bacterium]|nr:caspase family protein [Thermoanaerobaculia bacterium]